jgi:LPXTG-site transpeptidase (sortase) family protein
MGNGLLVAGVLLLFTTGAYYAYSFYSLSQIESFGETDLVVEDTLPENLASALAPTSGDETSLLSSFLASTPGESRALVPKPSTIGDDVPWEGLAYGPLEIYPANRIIIPAIEVDSRVVELGIIFEDGEWQWERPVHAVGHLKGTADPGQTGNIVMSGHISSPIRGEGQVFKRLPEIKVDDVVVLYTPIRAFAYQVVAKKVVLPTELSVLKPTPDETLTLITCVPDYIYSHRLIVTAKRIGPIN